MKSRELEFSDELSPFTCMEETDEIFAHRVHVSCQLGHLGDLRYERQVALILWQSYRTVQGDF